MDSPLVNQVFLDRKVIMLFLWNLFTKKYGIIQFQLAYHLCVWQIGCSYFLNIVHMGVFN